MDDLVKCARRWLPYGGPSAEEVFVNFGITKREFCERLWKTLPDVVDDPVTLAAFGRVYPKGPAHRIRRDSAVS